MQFTLSGNEVVRAAQGPGGSDDFLQISLVRNGGTMRTQSGSGAATYTALAQDSTLMWTGTAPTTWTVTTPVAPVDGQILTLGTDTTITTGVTLTATSGQSLSATYSGQTISAGSTAEWQYSLSATKWFRVR